MLLCVLVCVVTYCRLWANVPPSLLWTRTHLSPREDGNIAFWVQLRSDLSPDPRMRSNLRNVSLCRSHSSVPNRNVIVLRWFCDWKLSVGWVTAFDCSEISGPALTLQHSHPAKVPRPLEGSPGSWLHLRGDKPVSALLEEIYIVEYNGLQRILHVFRRTWTSGGLVVI